MRHPHNFVVRFSALALGLLIAASAAVPAAADLAGEVRAAVENHKLNGATIAVSIRDADTDHELVAINGRAAMIPASNMKLFTSGAALHLFGADFDFRTKLLRDGDRLVVVGDGDPGFGDPELLKLLHVGEKLGISVEEFIDLWVHPVVSSGMKRVSEIVVDDRIFDRVFVHDTWKRDQLNRDYSAEVSGLMFHLNVLHFYPRPQPGQAPDVSNFDPYAPWLDTSTNRATSRGGRDEGNTFGIARPADNNKLTFLGNVKAPYQAPAAVTVHDMPGFFARVLADRLAKAGVTVEAFRTASADDPAPRGEVIAPLVRTPISTAITRCNRDSQNLYAEALCKRLGYELSGGTQPGGWRNGGAAIRLIVNERLSDKTLTAQLVAADGSGLSRDNRISASLMTAWLNTLHRDSEVGGIFIDSLAAPGGLGTLSSRFSNWNLTNASVVAKSGYIDGVSCLSGFVTTSDGRRRSFSVLANDVPSGAIGVAKQAQEMIVKAIAIDMLADTEVLTVPGG